jgi:hypothetical protein
MISMGPFTNGKEVLTAQRYVTWRSQKNRRLRRLSFS